MAGFRAALASGPLFAPHRQRPGLDGGKPWRSEAGCPSTALGGERPYSFASAFSHFVSLKRLGVYHQPPSAPIPIPGIESFGFERGLQRNLQGSFGYEWQVVPSILRLEQVAYLGRLTNLQDYEIGDTEFEVEELEDVISQVSGWTYGLETLLKLEPGQRMFGWLSYTLSRSTRDFAIGGSAPSNWDQRHIINTVLGYELPRYWRFGGRVHYHTGRPWTSPGPNQTQSDALRTNRNNARLPAFFQLDLQVSKSWVWPDWQLQLTLDVANGTYSREIFACTPDTGGGGLGGLGGTPDAQTPMTEAMMETMQAQGIAGCTPQGFRYVVPSLELRARW